MVFEWLLSNCLDQDVVGPDNDLLIDLKLPEDSKDRLPVAAGLAGAVVGRPPGRVPGARVRPVAQQHADSLRVPVVGGHNQRGAAVGVLDLPPRPALHQHGDDGVVSLPGGKVEGRPAFRLLAVDVGARFQEVLHRRGLSVEGGNVQRGVVLRAVL